MKTKLTIAFVVATLATFAQDSIFFNSIQPAFNNQTAVNVGDTIDFDIEVSVNKDFTGPISYQMNNYDTANGGTISDSLTTAVEPQAGAQDSFFASSPKTVRARFVVPANAKNGNNTVVVWPNMGNNVTHKFDMDKAKTVNFLVNNPNSAKTLSVQDFVRIANAENGFNIISNDKGLLSVEVIDLTGKRVGFQRLGNIGASFKLRGLTTGVYFIRVNKSNKTYAQKVLVVNK